MPRSDFEHSMSALARDVSFLGRALGDVLREQGGETLFDAVEGLRQVCKRRRQRESGSADREVQRRIDDLPLDRALEVVRAFTIYFHLINMAEGRHRLRRIEQRESADYPAPRYESIAAAIGAFRAAQTPQEEVGALLARLSVRPVFTAHPTEARRMTLLRQLRRVSQVVTQLEDEADVPRRRERLSELLYAEITNLWQTNELRARQQTVRDEVRNGLYFFEHSVFDVTARIYRDLHDALREYYPALAEERYVFLSYGSWIGGDRDGNPNVTAEVTEHTVRMHKALALAKYIERVDELYDRLTPSDRLVDISEELRTSLRNEAEAFGDVASEVQGRSPDEPYRQKLAYIVRRLRATYVRNGVLWTGGTLGGEEAEWPAYGNAGEVECDLELIADSLRCHGGARLAREALQDLIWQVRVFGFHLASLDMRQHRDRHLEAVDELLRLTGLCAHYSSLEEEQKVEMLQRALDTSEDRGDHRLSESTREVLDVFDVMARMQGEAGQEALDTYIVSFTREVSDLIAVLYLAKGAGLFDQRRSVSRLRVVPLFETEDDLSRAADIMGRLFANPIYRRQMEAWGCRQEIMLGYSDSDKDAGYVTSNWRLYRGQQELMKVGAEAGVRVTFFHGRGGAIGRGGGPLQRAILGQPDGTLDGTIKVTEQGEVVFARYANPAVAHRHLEQVINAVIRASSKRDPAPARTTRWESTVEELSIRAARAYRELVSDDPDFLRFFEEGTPLRSIMRLRIASRPASRSSGHLRLAQLRAIPWVFAWTQSRFGLPGWYGLGTALSEAYENGQGEELQRMYREWPFFTWLIDAAQISLGKADLAVARRYSQLVTDERARERYIRMIEEEFQCTVRMVNFVAGQAGLLAGWPVLQRSIELRNPYVDPMSFLQIRAIQELRQEPDEKRADMLRAIVDRSVAGIAAGLQNTG